MAEYTYVYTFNFYAPNIEWKYNHETEELFANEILICKGNFHLYFSSSRVKEGIYDNGIISFMPTTRRGAYFVDSHEMFGYWNCSMKNKYYENAAWLMEHGGRYFYNQLLASGLYFVKTDVTNQQLSRAYM